VPLKRRVRRNLLLFAIVLALDVVVFVAFRSDRGWRPRLSIATAYTSTALLVFVLAIGPLNLLRRRPNPVSTNLRRDTGIWAGLVGLVHVAFGLQSHMKGKMLEYFLHPSNGRSLLGRLRLDEFGFANYTGLGATLILVLLLALSNDVSLRSLGSQRWKALQRTNYVAIVLIVTHGIVYQVMEERKLFFVVVNALLILIAVAFQVAGFRKIRLMRRDTVL
jgi:methionine sulfoxide reductase heme-binding subunit